MSLLFKVFPFLLNFITVIGRIDDGYSNYNAVAETSSKLDFEKWKKNSANDSIFIKREIIGMIALIWFCDALT